MSEKISTKLASYPTPKIADEEGRYHTTFYANLTEYNPTDEGNVTFQSSDYIDLYKCIAEFDITATGTHATDARTPKYAPHPFNICGYRTKDNVIIEQIDKCWFLEGCLKAQTAPDYNNVLTLMNEMWGNPVDFSGGKKIYWDFGLMGLNSNIRYYPLTIANQYLQFYFKLETVNEFLRTNTYANTSYSYKVTNMKVHCELIKMSESYKGEALKFVMSYKEEKNETPKAFPYNFQSYGHMTFVQDALDKWYSIDFPATSVSQVILILRRKSYITNTVKDKLDTDKGIITDTITAPNFVGDGILPPANPHVAVNNQYTGTNGDPTSYYQFEYNNSYIPQDRITDKRLQEIIKLKSLNRVKHIDGGIIDFSSDSTLSGAVKIQGFNVNNELDEDVQYGGINTKNNSLKLHYVTDSTDYQIDCFIKYDAQIDIGAMFTNVLR